MINGQVKPSAERERLKALREMINRLIKSRSLVENKVSERREGCDQQGC